MSASQLLAFLIPTLALNLTPGPDMLFVVGQSLRGGPAAAVKAAGGLWLGYLFHIGLVTLGLAAFLAHYPEAFRWLKIAGAGYLLVLGLRLLRRRGGEGAMEEARAASLWTGFFVSALNPKVAVFFLAFLPQFLVPGTGPTSHQLFFLGLLFSLTSTIVNTGAGFLALSLRGRRPHGRPLPVERACGVTMMGMAVRLLAS